MARATKPLKPIRAKPSTVEQASEHVPVGQRVIQHGGCMNSVSSMLFLDHKEQRSLLLHQG